MWTRRCVPAQSRGARGDFSEGVNPKLKLKELELSEARGCRHQVERKSTVRSSEARLLLEEKASHRAWALGTDFVYQAKGHGLFLRSRDTPQSDLHLDRLSTILILYNKRITCQFTLAE